MSKTLKKSLLILGIFSGLQNIQANNNDVLDILKDTAITAAIGGTISYWMYREPNSVKIERASNLWTSVKTDLFSVQNFQDLQEFFTKYDSLSKEVQHSYQEISARYSFIKPWNWSGEMKDIYEKISFLSVVFNSKQIMFMTTNPDEGQLLHQIRKYYADAKYPLLKAVSCFEDDIKILSSSLYKTTASQLLIDLLSSALTQIKVSSEYVKELEIQKEFEQLERMHKDSQERLKKLSAIITKKRKL